PRPARRPRTSGRTGRKRLHRPCTRRAGRRGQRRGRRPDARGREPGPAPTVPGVVPMTAKRQPRYQRRQRTSTPVPQTRAERQREENRAMVATIKAVREQAERQAERDWEISKALANEPMLGAA